MQPDSDDDAWRSIIDNYGDRADLGSDDAAPSPDGDVTEGIQPEPREQPAQPTWDDEQFVPPPPPPVPVASPDRMVAWTGLFGSPAILLTALVLGFGLPGWFGYLMVTWFIGGFVYLVALMPRGPRDPGDDGARL